MSTAAGRKPSVMTFQCERLIGHYGNLASGAAALKIIADETLFRELGLRGYDLSVLRNDKTTAEILKIR